MEHGERTKLLILLVVSCLLGPVSAQEPITLRGTIDRIEGPGFVLKTRYGAEVKFRIGENPEFFVARKVVITDLKPGEFVVAVSRSRPNGLENAVDVQILPDAVRTAIGTDLESLQNKNYCKGTVESITDAPDGVILSVTTDGPTRKLLVSAETPVVTFEPGEIGDLKPGVSIFATRAKKQPEGLLDTSLVLYGQNGTAPRL